MNIINGQKENNKAYFMLPGFCEHLQLYQNINKFLEKYPEAKRDEIEIYCYYGNIPFCTWDGGRIFTTYQPLSIEEIENIKDIYNNKFNSKIRLVFTNSLLQEEHLYEKYNNISLKIFHNQQNEIVLNSKLLEDYIKSNYPNYKLIASTTKCSNSEQSKLDLNNQDYIFTCLDYNLNHNWTFLNSLSPEEKAKTEFLINPICGPGCPQRKEHYRLNSLFSLTYGNRYNMKHCEITNSTNCAKFNPAHITINEIIDKYIPAGFHYFKLEGRTWPSKDMAIVLADYLIKPEYQSFFLRSVM